MKKLSIALINLPMLALGTALAQTPAAVDYDDMLSPLERALNRRPDLYPEWTWMTEGQAAQCSKSPRLRLHFPYRKGWSILARKGHE